jgi:hypothetical protein
MSVIRHVVLLFAQSPKPALDNSPSRSAPRGRTRSSLLRLIVLLLLQAMRHWRRCGAASARESRSVKGGDSMMPRP